MTALTLEVLPNGVGVVTFDVVGEPLNTLKPNFKDDFDAIVAQIETDSRIRALVLISGKSDSFIAGADVSALKEVTTAQQGEATSRAGQQALARWAALRVPTVAAINGPCLGGGLEVALACTARIASDDRKTVLGLPETQLGLLPGAGGTQRLPKLIGIASALDLILAAKQVKAAKAKKLGLVSEVVAKPILRQAAIELALSLANAIPAEKHFDFRRLKDPKEIQRLALEETPLGRALLFKKAREQLLAKTKGNYPAPEKALAAIEAGVQKGSEAGYAAEARGFGELLVTPQAKRLIEIFFATTAMKKESGVDSKTKPRAIARVTVLGGGLMGAGIAYVGTALGGYAVRIKERDGATAAAGLRNVRKIFDERVKRKSLTALEAADQFARLSATQEWLGFARTDLFIEAVFEDLALKQGMLRQCEALAPEAIYATNTSSLPIGKIATAAKQPEHVVGMHFFSPVHKMPLLEVIRAEKSSDEAVATAVAVGKKMGKTVIVVKDSTAFYTTRILGPYTSEAAHMLMEGAPIEQIDRALVKFGWPVGPLALIDEVGIDVGAKIAPIVFAAFGDRFAPVAGFEKLISDGRSGRKNGKGLYLYEKGRKGAKQADPSVYKLLGVEPNAGAVSKEDLALRPTLMFVNEAMHCWGEGILRSPRDGDIGAIFGLGFPPFLGGPFRWVDTLGAAEVVRRLEHFRSRCGERFTPAPALLEMAKSGKKFY
jgi:3-hydroxyacyl-CoA dehydrogenase/enoyl-CoA hydratase/3-hydroxybutyryl-CoA epimerase